MNDNMRSCGLQLIINKTARQGVTVAAALIRTEVRFG